MKYLYLFLFSISLLSISCRKLSNKCDETEVCFTDKPDSVFVDMQLSPPESGDFVEVRFYKGNVDDGELLIEFITDFEEEFFYVEEGHRYSAEVIYRRGDQTIVAVDGLLASVDYFYNCDQTCYDWEDEFILDVTLKE